MIILVTSLKRIREHAEITQEQLASALNTTQSAISRIENQPLSSCQLETIQRYVAAVGVFDVQMILENPIQFLIMRKK